MKMPLLRVTGTPVVRATDSAPAMNPFTVADLVSFPHFTVFVAEKNTDTCLPIVDSPSTTVALAWRVTATKIRTPGESDSGARHGAPRVSGRVAQTSHIDVCAGAHAVCGQGEHGANDALFRWSGAACGAGGDDVLAKRLAA